SINAACKSEGLMRFSKYPSAPASSAVKTISSSSTAVRITICVPGNNALSRDVHSIPDIRGKKMSINTTSGFSAGINRSASSADEQTQTQTKSSNDAINRDQLSRKSGLSSTNAIRNGIFRDDVFNCPEF